MWFQASFSSASVQGKHFSEVWRTFRKKLPLFHFRRTLKGGADFNDQLSRLCLLVFSAVNRYHKSCCSSHMAAGEPETACAYSFCWCLDRRTGDPKISWKASLRMCSACLVVFLVMGRRRVDKTNQYDLGNIRSTAPHFTDLELRSGDFIRDNESYPELISLSAVALPELVRKDRELRIWSCTEPRHVLDG